MKRTDLMDTSPWAYQRLLEILRKMPPEEKVRKCFELNDLAKAIRRAALEHERHRSSD